MADLNSAANARDAEFVARYDRPVPRYTSYPTAPHFTREVGADTYGRWLEALAPETTLSLYIHVPFCAELCLYCGCHTSVVRHYGPIATYLTLLEKEIGLVAARLEPGRPVVHIHWGGGTPTMLSPNDLLALGCKLRFHFDIRSDAEIAVEIDPRTLAVDQVAALAALGVTRASLGIQDFDGQVQRTINRSQSYEQTQQAAEWLHAAGIRALNFDLMYGLPHQTVETVVRTAQLALSLDPDRIALFGYAHVPWLKRHQALLPAEAMPDRDERLRQMRAAAEVLAAAGYVAIGLDHFAKPHDALARCQAEGRLRRNFQGYTADSASALVGFGASAIGVLPQGYVQNAARTVAYREAILAGRLATERSITLTDDDRFRRAIIERLMCDLVVDLDGIAAQFGICLAAFSPELQRLDELAERGLIMRHGNRIIVPEWGRPFVRNVCATFDRHLSAGEARYSHAV